MIRKGFIQVRGNCLGHVNVFCSFQDRNQRNRQHCARHFVWNFVSKKTLASVRAGCSQRILRRRQVVQVTRDEFAVSR